MYRFSYVPGVSGRAVEVTKELFHQIIKDPKVQRICDEIKNLSSSPSKGEDTPKPPLEGGCWSSTPGHKGHPLLPQGGECKEKGEEISRLKRQLPAFCWHAWFEEGKRKNYAAHASGLIMLDLDHVENPEELFERMKDKCMELGLVAAHVTPSTEGLRLVFPVGGYKETPPSPKPLYPDPLPLKGQREGAGGGHPKSSGRSAPLEGGCSSTPGHNGHPLLPQGGGCRSLEEAQAYYAKALKLKNLDACTKDLARLSFCVPESYFLYVDEAALFEGALPPAIKATPSSLKEGGRADGGRGAGDTSADINGKKQSSQAGGEEGLKPPYGGMAGTERQRERYPEDYNGLAYSLIVESLQELLGGVPAHGSRNNFIYSMSAYLRYVCDDNPEWIAQILPTYGEAHERWRRTIDSACQRAQYKQIPEIVRRALHLAGQKAERLSASSDEGNNCPPAMPKRLPKLIRHLTKNVPEVCRAAVANAVFPALAAHLKDVKFRLIDGTEKEATFMCVTMAKQSSGKSAINKPIEYIVADIVERDELNRRREQDWKDASANKAANKEKPKRPEDLCVQVLVSDMTNAAFVQRMKDAGGRYLYTNLEELDLLKQLQTNGTKDVGKIICLCFDNGMYGQERVGTQSVTARVELRWNWNAASTIQKGISFFKGRLVDGTLSRLNFCTIIPDKSKPFVYGKYDEKYAEDLKPFITNLNLATGEVVCKQALELAQRLSDKCGEIGALSDDEVYQDLSYRAVTIAYLKAMVLYIAGGMSWTKEIADFCTWSLEYDLWCKSHFFGDQVHEATQRENVKKHRVRKNLLDLLPTTFSVEEAQEVRSLQGMDADGCRQMINQWVYRGYIYFDETLRVYIKTEDFMKRYATRK